MKQSSLDVWEIRGLDAMTRILASRIAEDVPFTPQTVQNMRVHVANLNLILAHMEKRQGADCDPLSEIDRMDRWFCTGFANLIKYLNERIEAGPPMLECHRTELIITLQRMALNVTLGPLRNPEEKSNESVTS